MDNYNDDKFEMPNDTSGFVGDFDNHDIPDDDKKPDEFSNYLDKDKMYGNRNDGPGDPPNPPASGVILRETYDEESKKEEKEVDLNPARYFKDQVGYLEDLKSKLQKVVDEAEKEQEVETVTMQR